MTTDKLSQKLRNYTALIHAQLHVHPLLSPLQSQAITLENYYSVLQGMYEAYSYTEAQFSHFTDTKEMPILEWLEKDFLCHSLTPLTINHSASELPHLKTDDYSALIGYLYVKNGSGLGGRVISKHLEKYLNIIPHQTNFFFAGYGQEMGVKWKNFLSKLDDASLNHIICLNSAYDVFSTMKIFFDKTFAITSTNIVN